MSTSLSKSRNLTLPTRQAMLQRHPSVLRFWTDNQKLFEDAWIEWEQGGGHHGIILDRTLYSPALREAIERSWQNPEQESSLRDLWTEVFPNVYQAQFFDPEKLPLLRDYFDHVLEAGIPLRPLMELFSTAGAPCSILVRKVTWPRRLSNRFIVTSPIALCGPSLGSYFLTFMVTTVSPLVSLFNGKRAKMLTCAHILMRRL